MTSEGSTKNTPTIKNQLAKANRTVSDATDMLQFEDLSQYVNTDRIKYENLHDLNQVELFALLDKHKTPAGPVSLMGLMTLGYFGGMSYIAFKRGRQHMDKITAGKPKTVGTMVLYGTIVTCKVFLGYAAMLTPVMWYTDTLQRFVRQAEIRNRLGDLIIVNDEEMQDMILGHTIKYFGLSDGYLEAVKLELENKRIEQANNNQTLDAIVARLRSQGYLHDTAADTLIDKHRKRLDNDKTDDL